VADTATYDRNPYVMLRIPFGASRDAASAAFAALARGLRRAPDGAKRLTDLTWALNQVEEALKEPGVVLGIYRVPADPGALESDEPGVLRPPPERLPSPAGSSEASRQALLELTREEARVGVLVECASLAALPAR
jgi:hypothetical protein